jgi:hypothetical protein
LYRGGEFCPGKLTLGEILPVKNSVPELGVNGVTVLSPRGLEGLKRKCQRIFGLYFLVGDLMKLHFP